MRWRRDLPVLRSLLHLWSEREGGMSIHDRCTVTDSNGARCTLYASHGFDGHGFAGAVPSTPQRPDECPDVASHAPDRRPGDYRRERRRQCPSCGFWCLLPQDERPVESERPAAQVTS
jgi:hypothetical protein